MNQEARNGLAISDVQAIVYHHFGSDALVADVQPLTPGNSTAVYQVDLADGSIYVLKVAPEASATLMRYEQNIANTEVRVLRLVRAMTQVPVPTVMCHDASRTIIPREFYMTRFVPGVSLHALHDKLTADQYAGIQHEIGAHLRQLHDIVGRHFGYFGRPEAPGTSWRATFARMVADVLADGEDMSVPLPLSYAEVRDRLARRYSVLDAVTTPRLVHWDLWDANVLIDPVTMHVKTLIDFECALWGDPLMECNFGAFGAPQAGFLAGYGRIQPFTPEEKARRALYNAYLYLVMFIGCYYHGLHDLETWARPRLVRALQDLDGEQD